jgi:hypothetical protein
VAWNPPSTWTIVPVVAGNQSDISAQQAFAAGPASLRSQPSGARWGHPELPRDLIEMARVVP